MNMTSKEVIEKFSNIPGYIFKLKNSRTFLTMGSDLVMSLSGYMPCSKLKGEWSIVEVWKIGSNPGQGLSTILHDIELGKEINKYQAAKVCDVNYMSTAFLHTKVFVGTKSKEIQEKFFSLGYKWASDWKAVVKYLDKPFLYVDERGLISFSTIEAGYEFFTGEEHREVSISDILTCVE